MNTVDSAIDRVSVSNELQLREDLDAIKRSERPPESQIEEAFLVGLLGIRFFSWCIDFPEVPELPIGIDREMLAARWWHAEAHLQQSILDYRVDFLLKVYSGKNIAGQIIVECDGHFFHEITKEQARRDKSRDRRLVAAGYKVLRFTGRELYENSFECAIEVLKVARNMARPKK
jgi:very-short-patch-repair endonuclease